MNFKKISIFLLIILLNLPLTGYAQTIHPNELTGASAVLIDFDSGKVLYDKNMHAKVYPASTTKVLTALLVMDNLKLNEVIEVPKDFPQVDGSSLYLLPGERFTVKELLDSMLIHSCNDVAVLFANRIGGDILTFSKMMNEKAKSLGCNESNFVNPHGLHDQNHYTSAYDMSLIASEAMRIPEIKRIVSTRMVSLKANDVYKEDRNFQNTNMFLWSDSKIILNNEYIPIKWDLVSGIKTGYTLEAGNCLLSFASKDGMNLIACVFKADGYAVYHDSRLLLEYGFDNYKNKKIFSKDEVIGEIAVPRTMQKTLSYSTNQDFSLTVPVESEINYKVEFIKTDFSLPLEVNDKVGIIKVYLPDGEEKTFDAYAKNELDSIFSIKNIKSIFVDQSKNFLSIRTLIIAILIIIILIILRIIHLKIKNIKKKNRYKRL